VELSGYRVAFFIVPVNKPNQRSGDTQQEKNRNPDNKEKGIVGGRYKI
jgi:hypothetical protein